MVSRARKFRPGANLVAMLSKLRDTVAMLAVSTQKWNGSVAASCSTLESTEIFPALEMLSVRKQMNSYVVCRSMSEFKFVPQCSYLDMKDAVVER